IEAGLLVLVCAERHDTEQEADALLNKLLGYRVFADQAGKMNLSVTDTGGALLLVPQFTLAADTNSGTRPSFTPAAAPADGRHGLFSEDGMNHSTPNHSTPNHSPPGHSTLLLIRHGETPWNAVRRLQGHTDIALNEQGERQAAALAQALAQQGVEVLVASDLLRAMQTAQALSTLQPALTVQTDARLRRDAGWRAASRKLPQLLPALHRCAGRLDGPPSGAHYRRGGTWWRARMRLPRRARHEPR
ncbi:MAG: D-aminoacyl-tRNA deacylase, partial [Rhodospirillaceae bacterium]|nr:D-aminoacyl-tRNA deacylase [Rhodospirillaceae bacterium]